MKVFKLLDILRRSSFARDEFSFFFYKLLFLYFSKFEKLFQINVLFDCESLSQASSQLRRVCMFSGRARGTFRHYNASRFVLKGMHSVGILPGLQKLSW
jgi:ribosomal protein S14